MILIGLIVFVCIMELLDTPEGWEPENRNPWAEEIQRKNIIKKLRNK